jgi:hypothetical protein
VPSWDSAVFVDVALVAVAPSAVASANAGGDQRMFEWIFLVQRRHMCFES